jgi:hypothetical protein
MSNDERPTWEGELQPHKTACKSIGEGIPCLFERSFSLKSQLELIWHGYDKEMNNNGDSLSLQKRPVGSGHSKASDV